MKLYPEQYPEPALPGGADEKTPSAAQYFSWIGHTNEGSNEEQTLAYLGYFRYLYDTYGMKLDIFAWDAGNLDGARETYETFDGEKLSVQFPHGYAPMVKRAAEMGTRFGVWLGVDGMGNTPETAEARKELVTSLCRDHHFRLFKVDGVCGPLHPEHIPDFCDMMRRCRYYSPDLILLNHRLELGEGKKYATTFLWQGAETYVDVHIRNTVTAPHHRAFLFHRGLTPDLLRLTEDHGTCISSYNTYFDDDLIYQAFGRNLILAPEIYGNPWLLRDAEHARLARIYNLHRRLNDILVNGMVLDENTYGVNAVSRGTDDHRVLVFGNDSWDEKTVSVTLDASIGLTRGAEFSVIGHHPYETNYGLHEYGETVEIPVNGFRAALIEICPPEKAQKMPSSRPFAVLHENEKGDPDKIRYVGHGTRTPLFLGKGTDIKLPEDADEALERIFSAADNDSLERQSVRRAGKTEIPAVQAARDAFFSQRTYILRGCDAHNAFDGKKDTFYDALSKTEYHGFRIDGGCLRVDFGQDYDADAIEIEFFDADREEVKARKRSEFGEQVIPETVGYECSGGTWTESGKAETNVLGTEELPFVCVKVHNISEIPGRRMTVTYPVGGPVRRFRMAKPVDRIFRISLLSEGKVLAYVTEPAANNLMPPPGSKKPVLAKSVTVQIDRDDCVPGSYLAAAFEGVHGVEGAYACVVFPDETDPEKRYACAAERAPAFPSNIWECLVGQSDRAYTYDIPVTEEMLEGPVEIRFFLCDAEHTDVETKVYLCDPYLTE